jgi:hypothetical protein
LNQSGSVSGFNQFGSTTLLQTTTKNWNERRTPLKLLEPYNNINKETKLNISYKGLIKRREREREQSEKVSLLKGAVPAVSHRPEVEILEK